MHTFPHLIPSPPRKIGRRGLALAGALVLGIGGLAACGSDDDAGDATGEIAVTGAWARTSPMMASMGASYMVITNSGAADDTLLAASVDSSVAATAEIHETRAVDDTSMDDDTSDDMHGTDEMGTTPDDGSMPDAPMMEMVHIDRLDIPAGGSVTLEPGGYHVMLIDLAGPLAEGTELTITLTFERAGDLEVTAIVGDSAP